MMIEELGFILLPIAFVTIILALIIVIFARERSIGLLRSFYGYGVVIVAFIGVAISAIVLLNTLLNTTIFPSQENNYAPRYFTTDLGSPVPYGYQYEPGVREYLEKEQKVFDQKADQVGQTKQWRDNVVVAVPVLIVLLPLLYFFSRRFFRSDEADEVANQNYHVAIKAAYMYVISYLSLMALALGGIGLLNTAMTAILLPVPQDTYQIRNLVADRLSTSAKIVSDSTVRVISQSVAEQVVKDAHLALDNLPIRDENNATSDRNRSYSLSFSFLIIGSALYFLHRVKKA